MRSRKQACSCAVAVAALVGASALWRADRSFLQTATRLGGGGTKSRTLAEPAVGAAFGFDGDEDSAASCDGPYAFMPEHRHRVEARSSGTLSGNVRALFDEMSTGILRRWGAEYEDKLFGGAMAWSDGGRVVEDKMLNAVLEQDSFVAAFTGNSIAAGHDCLYEQSYPVLLNATMGRLMAAAGVGYTAINVAMGNTRVVPYSYCVDAHAGLDADVISWSFGMEMSGFACDGAAAAVELFIRSSLVLPRRPAVLIMDAQGDQATNAPLKMIKNRNARFLGFCGKGQQRDLIEAYRDFGLHSIFASALVLEHTVGDDRFSADDLYGSGKHYPRPMRWHPGPSGHELVADMLFMHYGRVLVSALERLEEAQPGLTAAQLRAKKQEEEEQGRQQEGGGDDNARLSGTSWTALREAVGLGPGNPNVVSSSSSHSTSGENREDVSAGREVQFDGASPAGRTAGCSYMGGGRGRGVLPPAEWCSNPHCEEAGNFRCANTYSPLGGNQGSRLLDMIVVPKEEEGDEHGDGFNRLAHLVNGNKKNLLVSPAEGRWAVTLNEVSPPALEYMRNAKAPEGFHKPIDTKWVLVGDAASGPIEFEFFTGGLGSPGSLVRHDIGGDRQPGIQLGGESDELSRENTAVTGYGDGVPEADAAAQKKREGGQATGGAREAAVAWGGDDVKRPLARVAVCKPDFIDRVDFADPDGVRFTVDGVVTSAVPGDEDGLATRSCSLLAAEIGPGLHRLRVEPLRKGEPWVAISHIIYPA